MDQLSTVLLEPPAGINPPHGRRLVSYLCRRIAAVSRSSVRGAASWRRDAFGIRRKDEDEQNINRSLWHSRIPIYIQHNRGFSPISTKLLVISLLMVPEPGGPGRPGRLDRVGLLDRLDLLDRHQERALYSSSPRQLVALEGRRRSQ